MSNIAAVMQLNFDYVIEFVKNIFSLQYENLHTRKRYFIAWILRKKKKLLCSNEVKLKTKVEMA